ncbi:energy transducer TonB [Mucilaginibacter sp.]|uniref:energy transducer TonB n=1 Tax=Mucilaginibacter sp. TaxID=1882438 RepID=UPI003266BFB2
MKQILVIVFIFSASFAKAQHTRPRINMKDTTVYTAVEQQPQFGKDEGAFNKYLLKNLRYAGPYPNENSQGRITAIFIIEKDGSVKQIKIVRPQHTSLERSMIGLLKASPKWRPAIHKGYVVRCQYFMPLFICLASEE